MTKEKSKDFDQFEEVMDIVRKMSQEEITELLEKNPLYKFVTENDKKVEKKWRIKKK